MTSRKIQSLAAIVGENIASRRKVAGITQNQLAERLNISGAAMSRIESGMAAPRFTRLEEIAEILNCHVADLFRTQSDDLTTKLGTVEDMLRSLPPDTQDGLIHLMTTTIQTFKSITSPKKANQ